MDGYGHLQELIVPMWEGESASTSPGLGRVMLSRWVTTFSFERARRLSWALVLVAEDRTVCSLCR